MLSFLHGSSSSRVKIWTKLEGEESHELLFNDVRDMAKVLIVGVPYTRASVRVTGGHLKVDITVLSPNSWRELWERPIDNAIFCQSSELLKALFHDLPDEEPHAGGHGLGHEQGENSQQTTLGSSSSSSFTEAPNPPINPPPVDPLQGPALPSQDVEERWVQQAAERSALEITIYLGCEPGAGIEEESELRLSRKAGNCCVLSSTLKLNFSMIEQPPILSMHNERAMNVEVCSIYELPCRSVVEDEGPESEVHGQEEVEQPRHDDEQPRHDAEHDDGGSLRCIRVGILHDLLAANFKCISSPAASMLCSSSMVGVTSMDMTEKSTSTISRQNEFGLNVGGVVGHPGSGFQVMGSMKHARLSAKDKEYGMASKVDVLGGTDFILVDRCQRRETSFDVLGFEAIHQPSLGLLSSLEEGGLHMCVGEPVVSALGRTATLQFRGTFLLDGERVEKHELSLSRRLAEMTVTTKQQKWFKRLKGNKEKVSTKVVLGKQVKCFAFFVNHDFSLDLYQGAKLVWKLRRARASPIPCIIDLVAEQHAVPHQQLVVLQQHAAPQRQVVPEGGGPQQQVVPAPQQLVVPEGGGPQQQQVVPAPQQRVVPEGATASGGTGPSGAARRSPIGSSTGGGQSGGCSTGGPIGGATGSTTGAAAGGPTVVAVDPAVAPQEQEAQ